MACKMSLIIVGCLLVLLNPGIGKARIIDSTIDERFDIVDIHISTHPECEAEMGIDEGEGQGAPLDDNDEANAQAIDLETEVPPGEDYIRDNIEETEKLHQNSSCFFEGDIVTNPEVQERIKTGDRSATTIKQQLWKKYDGVVHVPYVISSSYNSNERAVIKRAVDEYAKYTCIR